MDSEQTNPKRVAGQIFDSLTDMLTLNDTKRADAVDMEQELVTMNDHYNDVYAAVEELNRSYLIYKRSMCLCRYFALKTMIQACITDDLIERASIYVLRESDSQPMATGSTVDLINATKAIEEKAKAIKKLPNLNRKGLIAFTKDQQLRKEKLQRMSLRLFNRLQTLKMNYEHSSRYTPLRRYYAMKDMVKTITRDETLQH